MAREVSVKITANTSGFNSGMDAAGSKAAQTAAKIKGSFDSGLTSIGKNSRSINAISSGLGKVGLVAAVGFGAAVKSAAEFDSAMSSVAATGADARANLTALREAAIKAGADTKFSATEAAQGIEELAKAGVSSKDALGGGLSAALNLAAAGNQSVAESAETAASALNQFGLSGAQAPHVADLLAQAAGTAQGEVSDMAAALNQSGLVANQFGLSIDETAQSLALFAKNGLTGSDAGTSFKTMLTSLYAPAGTGAKALDKLGISAYDASGALKPIGEVADDLKSKLDGLSEQDRNQALKNIFGSDALRTGTILLREGSAGLSSMATEFGKFGSAADVARTKMDNLKGDLEQLKGSFETALIGLGEGGTGPLRSLVQDITGAVNAFNDLGDGTKGAVLAVGGIAAASALGVAGVLKLATGAAEAYGAFGKLSSNAPRLAGALRGVGTATVVLAAALIAARAAGAGVNAIIGDTTKSSEEAANALAGFAQNASLGAIGLNQFASVSTTGDLFANGEQKITGISDAIGRLGNPTGAQKFNDVLTGLATNITGVKGSAEILSDRFGQLDTRLSQVASTNGPQAASAFKSIAQAAAEQNVPVEKLVSLFPEYAASVRQAAEASGQTVGSTQQLADLMSGQLPAGVSSTTNALAEAGSALDAIGSASSGAAGDLGEFNTQLLKTANAALATSNAQIGFKAAIDAAADAAKKNGQNLKTSSAAGRENATALNNVAAAGLGYVQSLIDQGKSAKSVKAATQDARDAFIKSAEAMGKSAPAAKKLADQYGLIPKKVVTEVETKTGASKAEIAKVKEAIKDLPKKQQTEILTAYKAGGIEAAKAKLAELTNAPAKIEVSATVDTTALSLAKGELDYFGQPIQTNVNVTATGVGETNSQIDTTQRGRAASTRSSATGVGATNSQIDTTQRGRAAATRSKAVGVPQTNAAIDKTSRGRSAAVKAQATGTAAANSALNNVARSRTATIRVTTVKTTVSPDQGKGATGGMITHAGFIARGPLQRRSNGGPVWGAGTATSDSIPALLSDGEFVIRAAAVKAVGMETLTRLNAQGFARGGAVGFAKGGKAKKKKKSGPPATTDASTIRLVQLEDAVDNARNIKELVAAQKSLEKATKNLSTAQTKATEAIRALAASTQEPYRSKSTDVDDVLAAMVDGAKDITAFGAQIKNLKSLGLDQAVIDQITAAGAINGGELASQILAGGSGLVKSLNQANRDLEKASNALGQTAEGVSANTSKPKPKPKKKKALGGYITGPGTGTSDEVDDVLLSNGEYVVNARATSKYRSALDAINYGRAQINEHRFMPAYAGGLGSVASRIDRSINDSSQIVLQYQGNVEQGLRLARAAKRDNLTMARLSVPV